MCGEYGETTQRPHFHACIFGHDFEDKKYFKTDRGNRLYTSATLDRIWGFGQCLIGAVTFESAAYTARYIMKKITGDQAEEHYTRVDIETGETYKLEPEFCHMSLKPGIGAPWLQKYTSDIYPDGQVVVRGMKTNAPKYYEKKYKKMEPLQFEEIEYKRELLRIKSFPDSTNERLKVREQVAHARISLLKRAV